MRKTANLLSSKQMWSPSPFCMVVYCASGHGTLRAVINFLFYSLNIIKFQVKLQYLTSDSCLILPVVLISELKRRMKAEKKTAEKEAKVKEEQQEQKKESNDHICADEETLDSNVRFFYGQYSSLIRAGYSLKNYDTCTLKGAVCKI